MEQQILKALRNGEWKIAIDVIEALRGLEYIDKKYGGVSDSEFVSVAQQMSEKHLAVRKQPPQKQFNADLFSQMLEGALVGGVTVVQGQGHMPQQQQPKIATQYTYTDGMQGKQSREADYWYQ